MPSLDSGKRRSGFRERVKSSASGYMLATKLAFGSSCDFESKSHRDDVPSCVLRASATSLRPKSPRLSRSVGFSRSSAAVFLAVLGRRPLGRVARFWQLAVSNCDREVASRRSASPVFPSASRFRAGETGERLRGAILLLSRAFSLFSGLRVAASSRPCVLRSRTRRTRGRLIARERERDESAGGDEGARRQRRTRCRGVAVVR